MMWSGNSGGCCVLCSDVTISCRVSLTILVFRQSLPVDNGDCLDFFERDVLFRNHRGGNPRQPVFALLVPFRGCFHWHARDR
jgi:hypothetical protein